jgi:cytochrome c oxidase subunit 1
MLFALGFIVTFVNGGITGLFLGNVIIDIPLSDTYFVVAHFHMVMGIAPLMVVFGAIYHWYPLITGRHLNQTLGKIHFWVTFLGAYAIYFPMHYLGFIGVPRRYFEMYDSPYMTSGVGLNQFITVAALIVGFTQILFLYNIFSSVFKGEKSERNPWKANSLEWHTPDYPPTHGNFGKELPVVYRWPYDFSVPGSDKEHIPQNVPPSQVPTAKAEIT